MEIDMKIEMRVNVVINGETVSAPLEELHTCCCGETVADSGHLSECLKCGGFMCMGPKCDCTCEIEFDNDYERLEFLRGADL